MKAFLIQTFTNIIPIIIIGGIIIYIVFLMINNIKATLINNPYPYIYNKPSETTSPILYDGGNLNAFIKTLDDIADRLD